MATAGAELMHGHRLPTATRPGEQIVTAGAQVGYLAETAGADVTIPSADILQSLAAC